MSIAEILSELSAISAPSGFETPIAARVGELLSPFVDKTYTDVMGNVVGERKCGAPNAKRLLLDAHIDEIGFIVTRVEDGGFLRFASLGGVDARMLPASTLKILTEPPIYGVVDVLPPHVQKSDESEKAIKLEDLVLDIGLGKDAATAAVPVGTPAVYDTAPRVFAGKMICGKALDDRAGVAVILRALELLGDFAPDIDIFVLGSAQEEVGTRGAKTAAFEVAPDYCVAVDTDFAVTPDMKIDEGRRFGGGVVITRGPNMNKSLTDTAVQLARDGEIAHQIAVEPGGDSGTNARVIQISREGVATALFGIPLKYMHTPRECAHIDDLESAAALLCALIKSLGGGERDA